MLPVEIPMLSPLHFKSLNQSGKGMLTEVLMLLLVTITLGVSVSLLDSQEKTGDAGDSLKRREVIKVAIGKHKADSGSNPTNLDLLVSNQTGSCSPDVNTASPTFRTLRGWCGPYLSLEFTQGDLHKRDSWGSLFSYDGINLRSCGPNRSCGDSDDIVLAL
jgi:hypothetical protein